MLAEERLRYVDRALVVVGVPGAVGLEQSVLGIEGIDAIVIGGTTEFLHENAIEAGPGSLYPALQTVEAGEILADRHARQAEPGR